MPHNQACREAERNHDFKDYRITMIRALPITPIHHGHQVNQANQGLRQGASHAA